jgi:acetyltransferase-like isoleucine patch superfamily enzyme
MSTPLRQLVRRLIDRLPPRLQARIAGLRSAGERATVGPLTYIHHTVQMLGRAYVRVGTNSVLSQDCWLNVNHRVGDQTAIDIGDNCFIGRRNFFSAGRRISVGHYVLTANDCHFLGSSHIVDDPMQPYIATGTTNTDVIDIGHNTFIGAGAKVLGHVSIGHGCVVGACALVTKDIPPFSQVAGFPASIRRRYSFLRNGWIDVDDFTTEDEVSQPTASQYLEQLRMNPAPRMPYLAAGSNMGQC